MEKAKNDAQFKNLLDCEQHFDRFDVGLVGPSSSYSVSNSSDTIRRIANHYAVVTYL